VAVGSGVGGGATDVVVSVDGAVTEPFVPFRVSPVTVKKISSSVLLAVVIPVIFYAVTVGPLFKLGKLHKRKMLVNCSECVRAESHNKFYSRFAAYGIKKESLAACYAMAETTFAITQTPLGSEATRIVIDKEALSRGDASQAVSFSGYFSAYREGET